MLTALLLIILPGGCSKTKVVSYPHAGAEFERYRTYKLQSHDELAEVSPRGHAAYQRLGDLIAEEMEARQYRYHIDADLLVEFEISSGLGSPRNRSSYYDPFYYPYYAPTMEYGNTQSSELLIEIVIKDRKRKKPAWTGSADLTLRGRASEREEKIRAVIQEIFARFTYTAAN